MAGETDQANSGIQLVAGYEPPTSGASIGLKDGPYRHPTDPNQVVFEFLPELPPAVYVSPLYNAVSFNLSGPAYAPPVSGTGVTFNLTGDGESGARLSYVGARGADSLLFGDPPKIWNYITPVQVSGFTQAVVGSAFVELGKRYLQLNGRGIWPPAITKPVIKNRNVTLRPSGIPAGAFGWAELVNFDNDVFATGFNDFRSGTQYIWNLLQKRSFQGFKASLYGKPALLGGVKYVDHRGYSFLILGRPTLINTTADQEVRPKGVSGLAFGVANVSPRILYPYGIYRGGYGEPVVQFPPFPKGWESSRTGRPHIEYWTKLVYPEGAEPGEIVGYPRVFDPTQIVYPPSLLGTGIFGDILVVNQSLFVYVPGEDYFSGSDWAELRSNRRSIDGRGFDAVAFGAGEVRNKTPSVVPQGIQPVPVSPHYIGHRIRYVYGRGFQLVVFGRPTLTRTPSIEPAGMAGEAGTPTIWFGVRAFDIPGFNSQKLDKPTVWFKIRPVQLEGQAWDRYGKPGLEHGNRTVRPVGSQLSRYGWPRISNLNRYVYPEGAFKEFETVHMVGGTRFLKVFGFEATRFGTRIIPPIQQVYARGFDNPYGWPLVYNLTQRPVPEGFTNEDRWGKGKVYNLRQYIQMYFDPDSGLTPPEWPRWTLIENRSKTIVAIGSNLEKRGNPTIYNNARLLRPAGMGAPQLPDYYESGMVAYRIRRLPLQGLEAPYISSWHRVYNDAFVIAPRGAITEAFGVASAKNTRRYFDRIGGFQSEQYGSPMIADRIREIVFEPRYSIAPPRINLHTVDLYTRYMDGIGVDLSGYGVPDLLIRFNKIQTRWSHRDEFGWSIVRNLTPEIGQRGRASDVFGDTFVRLEWRPVNPDGSRMQLFGQLVIADRDRIIPIDGFHSTTVSTKHKVIKTGQPPYTDQFIFLFKANEAGEQLEEGYGIPPPGGKAINVQVPPPGLNQYVLFPRGFTGDKYGTPFAQSNAIIVDDGIWDADFGEAFFGLKNREIAPVTAHEGHVVGKPRLSPHTIWARPAPQQANQNHPESRPFRPVGEFGGYPAGTRFGLAWASTYRGEVYPRSVGNAGFVPKPRLDLRLRYIHVESFSPYRNGWHKIGDGTQWVNQLLASDTAVFGRPTFERAPYTGPQTVSLLGISAPGIPAQRIEFFNREVFARGTDFAALGTRKGGDTPYMWQGLRVGPLMPTIPHGFTNESWGDAWVSRRVRELHPGGFNAFASEYELSKFKERMRVRNAYIPRPPEQSAAPVGVDGSGLGVPNIKPGTHFIKPDGNADQYRKGAF